MAKPNKLYKTPSNLRKVGDDVKFETHRQTAKGKVVKVKPNGDRIVKLKTHKLVKKKKEDLK